MAEASSAGAICIFGQHSFAYRTSPFVRFFLSSPVLTFNISLILRTIFALLSLPSSSSFPAQHPNKVSSKGLIVIERVKI